MEAFITVKNFLIKGALAWILLWGDQLEDGVLKNTPKVGGFSNLSGLPDVLGSWYGPRSGFVYSQVFVGNI